MKEDNGNQRRAWRITGVSIAAAFLILVAGVVVRNLVYRAAYSAVDSTRGTVFAIGGDHWSLQENVLTISGSGEMGNYSEPVSVYNDDTHRTEVSTEYTAPWYGNVGKIQSAVIEDGVTSIGCCAFLDCSVMTEVTIPAGVTKIGYRAFDGCGALTDINYAGSVSDWEAVDICCISELAEVQIHCADGDAPGTSGIPEWSLEDGVLTISGTGDTAALTMSYLDAETYPGCPMEWKDSLDQIREVVIEDGVTTVADSAFRQGASASFLGEKLTAVTLPDSVRAIGNSAFQACPYLRTVTFPDGLEYIGGSAFQGCDSLEELVIPDSVGFIGDSAFSGCEGLTSVTLPSGISKIADDTFDRCESLTEITIPAGVTEIGQAAFWACDALTDVYYAGSEEDWAAVWIEGENDALTGAVIHYNCG